MRVLEVELRARANEIARAPILQRVTDHLEQHLGPLLGRPLELPDEKAQLSRDGGICQVDGARLLFDPLTPHAHTCPRCHATYEGARHHRAWIMRYQLWLSERAIHCALLGVLRDEPALLRKAVEILTGYASRYRSYPNRDNVLGPTRLFFSTYLESIWLVQIATAAAILDVANPAEWGGDGGGGGAARAAVAAMVGESAELIGSFEEGWSNRQVWNATALLAAGTWLGDERLRRAGLDGGSGVRALLSAVDDDGYWHEGENYHLFALRGFLLAAEWARWGGTALYDNSPLGRMYTAPLATLLPNFVVPARGDAPYGASVRQHRFAELWEIGRARVVDPRLDAVLARLYDDDLPDAPDVGFVELAEQEEHRAPGRIRRDQLGWKALLWMVPESPESDRPVWETGAALLPAHGVAMLRPQPDVMVTVECGPARGGHAHPDLLHLSVYWGADVLVDFGTGSYVSDSLFWYRSTLAHNAPGVAGVGQVGGVGWCEHVDAADGWNWTRVAARDTLGEGTLAHRTVLAGHQIVVDMVDVSVPPQCVVDLPLHVQGLPAMHTDPVDLQLDPGRGGGGGHETGYDRVRAVGMLRDPYLPIASGDQTVTTWLVERWGEDVLVAEGAGPPGSDFADGAVTPFLVRRAAGPGRWTTVYATAAAGVKNISLEDGTLRVHGSAATWTIAADKSGITVSGAEGTHVRLEARAAGAPYVSSRRSLHPRQVVLVRRVSGEVSIDRWPAHPMFALGRDAYRRSEEEYGTMGLFSALVDVAVLDEGLAFFVDVTKDQIVVRDANAPDPGLDNESADIHSDGVQVYLDVDGWEGYVVLPDLDSGRLRPRAVVGTVADTRRVSGASRRTSTGYRMLIVCDVGRTLQIGERFPFNVVVNEMRAGRDRRAGQLALTGGGWVYLRGDRESPAAALVAEVV